MKKATFDLIGKTPLAVLGLGLLMPLSCGSAAPPSKISAEAETRAALLRVEQINPLINAVIAVDPTALDSARKLDQSKSPRGPLFGAPVLIKDNIETKGPVPTAAGSLALQANVTGRDAPLVARLRAAGAIILGKTNLSEWANIRSDNSISGWSAVGGQTRNPHALNRNTCGSSSGSGAAVAAGIVTFAIGTETNGSITCPAAMNGIVGLKPSVGLVSRTHIIPISHSQDTAGPMTRTVRDAAQLLTVIAGSDPSDPATAQADQHKQDYAASLSATALKGARLGVLRFATGFGTDAAFEAALQTLREQGATLIDIPSFPNRREIGAAESVILFTELKADLNAYLGSSPAKIPVRNLADVIAFNKANAAREMGLFGQELFEKAQALPGLDDPAYIKARADATRLTGPEGIDRLLRDHNLVALVGPTMPPAWLIDSVNGDQSPGGGAGSLAAIAGYPHLTVPMGTVQGLPVGLSFMGAKWSEAQLLSLGYAFEQAAQKQITPRFLPSIEQSETVAPLLAPLPPAGR